MNKVKIHFYVDNYVEVKEFNYEVNCGIVPEEGLIQIYTDGDLQLVINREHFISFEKLETPKNEEIIITTNIDGDVLARRIIEVMKKREGRTPIIV